MQNNWNIEADLAKFFNKEEYIIAFPSNIAIIKKGFEEVSIKTVIHDKIVDKYIEKNN